MNYGNTPYKKPNSIDIHEPIQPRFTENVIISVNTNIEFRNLWNISFPFTIWLSGWLSLLKIYAWLLSYL